MEVVVEDGADVLGAVDRVVVVVAPGTVVAVGAEIVVGVTTVVAVRSVVVVDSPLCSSWGAATLRGDEGRSLTRSSAALTICQVRAVVRTTTTSHPPANASRLT
ncbi:MAG: hypothetical protein V3S32_00725 [Acidimicrobiia bacterium]